MSSTPEAQRTAGWGCLYLLVIVAFLITLGATLVGGSPFWAVVFGIGAVLCFVKAYKDDQKKQANG